jgi:O-succinylbenzoic acid--CoA ligase
MLESPWLATRADMTPNRVAILAKGATLTWRELDVRVRARAADLFDRGVRAGDVVAALLRNGLPFVELVHALDRCGATLLPLNARLTPRELAFQLGDCGARLLLHSEGDLGEPARAAGAMAPGVHVLELAEPDPGARHPEVPTGDAEHLLAVLYTSGTTGRPKGASLSRANFLWSAVGSAFHLGVDPRDRWLVCMPLFHVGGLSILLRSALYGTASVIHERFDADALSEALDRDRITQVSLTSTMLQHLLDARGARDAPRTLRFVLLGGGPCAASLLARASARGFRVLPTYGLTEAASQVATRDPEADDADLLALTPLPGTRVRVVDERGRDVPACAAGEILVRGPSVMQGYTNRPRETARTLRGGWLHTGDVGALDAAGRLRVLDRRSDLIVSGGENVYPAEVEAALLEHPAVAEAGVAGAADPDYGSRPEAWWVLSRGHTAPSSSALRSFCRERLAGFKLPVAFHRVEQLPRNASGKLLRRRLAAEA